MSGTAASAAPSDSTPQASSATPAPQAPIAVVAETPPRLDAPAAATPAPTPAPTPVAVTPAPTPVAATPAPTPVAVTPAPTPVAATPAPTPAPAPVSPLATTEEITLATAFTPLVQATIKATPNWPVWYGTGKPVNGVNCLVSGKVHLHSLISIYKDGKRLGFPDGIGRVHGGCYHAYELHVHDVTGIIHMETDVPKKFKLGQWFSLWGQPLSRDGAAGLTGPVRFYVIEKNTITRYDGNPADIDMALHREILIVTGSTMSVVPKYQWPAGI